MITEEGVAFAPSRTPQVPFHSLVRRRKRRGYFSISVSPSYVLLGNVAPHDRKNLAPLCCCHLQEMMTDVQCKAHSTIYSCVLRLASSHHPTSSFRSCEERRRMGNCQAPEAVVIQHPGGREEQLYWPMSAADVMKSNPGYHVALVTLCVSEERGDGGGGSGGVVRLTRVRLLKPKDVLLLGQVYRLVTSQEVTMALRARKQEKLNKCQQHRTNDQVAKQERDRQRSGTQMAARARQWRPSLQSIAEAAS